MSAPGFRERDPHFRNILAGLAAHQDKDGFEECVRDLLRDAFPSLTGVHGGSDAGMDGAIADGQGEPYPLVVTTSDRVIRNLTGSLESYLAKGGARRRVVVATSSALSPARRRNLQQTARELGFVLVQTFDRRDIASRLYRDSKWTKELLGITGEPSALTAVPRTRRPLLDLEPVAREADLAWLRETGGDRLLVGEPGSGKTFLLLQLVREGRALFLATDDEGRFAGAYRDQRPEIVLVDDAHLDPERLERLRQIRQDMQAEGDFDIVASSWTGPQHIVADALGGLPSDRLRQLELLTRAEVLEVLRQIGVRAPDDDPYLAELIEQAANRPGLAVTLGTLWLRGDYRDVLTGRAILRSMVPGLRRVMEQDPTQLLAGFALGGRRGMGLAAVAEFLESGRGEVWELAAQLSSAGILAERGRDEAGEAILAVIPSALRGALLHEVFFSSQGRAWEPLLRRAPSRNSALKTLIEAARRKVPVPRDRLRELLDETGASDTWARFALLGENEGAWVLERYPGAVADIARQALETVPEAASNRLLREAESPGTDPVPRPFTPPDPYGLNKNGTERALRILREWIQDIPDAADVVMASLRRRRALVEAVVDHLEGGGDQTVGLRAASFALSPRLERNRAAASGGALVLREGSLPPDTVPEMSALWQRVHAAMPGLAPESWHALDNMLRWWIHPFPPRRSLGEEGQEPFHEMARRIVSDLVPFAEGHPGLASALEKRAREIDLSLALSLDPDFETLCGGFPSSSTVQARQVLDAAAIRREARSAAQRLGRTWARRRPQDVVEGLARYREEARWGSGSLGAMVDFAEALAQEAEAPEEWLAALLDLAGAPSLISGFLLRVVEEQRPGWRRLLDRCLNSNEHAWTAADRVLRMPTPPDDLLEGALEASEPQQVETACLQGKVPVSTLRRLLAHADPRMALAAAVGEWLLEPRQEVRGEIREEWRAAVLRSPAIDFAGHSNERYWLEAILSQDAELAFDWLRETLGLLGVERGLPLLEDGPVLPAIRALERSQRARLLGVLEPTQFTASLLPELVGESEELYEALLGRAELRSHHLAPFAGRPPDRGWVRLARLALRVGHEPRAVAEASFRFVGVYWPSVELYRERESAFRELLESQDPALREVARHGLAQAAELVSEEDKKQRRFQLAGGFLQE